MNRLISKTETIAFDWKLDSLLESFSSSKTRERIEAFSEMYHISSHYYVPHFFTKYELITKIITKSLLHNNQAERKIVLQNLQLMAINVPEKAQNLFNLYHKTLINLVVNKASENVKIESLRCLSVLCLLNANNEMGDKLNTILFQLIKYSNKKTESSLSEKLCIEILRTYGILLTCLPSSFLENPLEEEYQDLYFYQFDYLYNHFLKSFRSRSSLIKNECAQQLTLLWSIKESDETLDNIDFETQLEDLIDQFNDLALECTKGNNKNKIKKKSKFKK